VFEHGLEIGGRCRSCADILCGRPLTFVLACTRLMFSQLVADMDDNLFANIRHKAHHLLHKRLPDYYNLRQRCHSFSLSVKTDSRNYINRMLFKDIY